MRTAQLIAECFFIVPLSAILIINFLPLRRARKIFSQLAGTVAILEGVLAAAEFFVLLKLDVSACDFNIFYSGADGDSFFRVRRFSLYFMACISLVAFSSAMIAKKTIQLRRRSYVNLLMCLIMGMNGMLMSTDLFSLYVFLEIVGISSFVMIAMFRSRTGLEGSFKYLVVSAMGVMLLLIGLSLLLMQTGSLDYTAVSTAMLDNADASHKALTYAAVILMICGFAVKTGAVPFHSWLPDAHQSADTAVSVLLSGIVIKIAGIYGLYIVRVLFGELEVVQLSYQVIGVVSILYGAILASRQEHFKRICAYSSVSQMGYIILGLSTNTYLGLFGAAAHVFSHAVFKSTLFTNAAALHEQTGTLNIREMGGLEKKMPVTSFSSVIAFLSTAGIPPLSGFWSKLFIVIALWSSGNQVWGAAALILSIFTSGYFLRLQKNVFFGKTPDSLEGVKEISGTIKYLEIILTAITIGVGLAFPLIIYLLNAYVING